MLTHFQHFAIDLEKVLCARLERRGSRDVMVFYFSDRCGAMEMPLSALQGTPFAMMKPCMFDQLNAATGASASSRNVNTGTSDLASSEKTNEEAST